MNNQWLKRHQCCPLQSPLVSFYQESDIAEILDLLRSKSSTRRHVRLATLLDKLVAELYLDLSPIDVVVTGSADDLSLSR